MNNRWSCLAASLALLAASGAQGQETPRIGTVKQVQGSVQIVRAERAFAAQPGEGLQERDRVESIGKEAGASLQLRDGTVVSLGAGSQIDLSRYRFDGTTQEGEMAVRLLRGTLRMVTGLLPAFNRDRVRIFTPTLTVGVRGTDFIVEAP